jgi:hypothetical protein
LEAHIARPALEFQRNPQVHFGSRSQNFAKKVQLRAKTDRPNQQSGWEAGINDPADLSATDLGGVQHMKKVFAILLALSAVGIVMSGCSGGGDAEKPAADAPKKEGE